MQSSLAFVPADECHRILNLPVGRLEKRQLFADVCRINTLFMIAKAGSGHIGTSFSCLDILATLFIDGLREGNDAATGYPYRDLFFSSKGHDVPAVYACLIALGHLPFDSIHTLRRLGGLPGHPDRRTPGLPCNTGSLGMGISKAKGFVHAARAQGLDRRCFVLTGDGELQEGQIWESLQGAANRGLHEITVIVDHNKIQSDIWVHRTSDLGDLDAKFAAFGWHVQRCNGHDPAALDTALANAATDPRPSVIIADTLKGAGAEAFLHTAAHDSSELYRFHSGAPAQEARNAALSELVDRIERTLRGVGAGTPLLLHREPAAPPPAAPAVAPQRLIDAYAAALLEEARHDPRIVALDADLKKDCGLLPLETELPDRFVECGIAEQDMVSQAGAMSLSGMLPVVHSFACFLTPRAAEQIYNNASEHTAVTYVGSLVGVVPGGPGHSHQSIRDIALMGGVPGSIALEPCCEAEVAPALRACLAHPGPSYLRLVSIPCDIPYSLPENHRLEKGKGHVLLPGTQVAVIGYGPVLLPQAWHAAHRLAAEGVSVTVIDLPWLNHVDPAWLAGVLSGKTLVVTLDNHLLDGGQGQRIAAAMAGAGIAVPVLHLGPEDFPPCGRNDEVLAKLGLDADGIARAIHDTLQSVR